MRSPNEVLDAKRGELENKKALRAKIDAEILAAESYLEGFEAALAFSLNEARAYRRADVSFREVLSAPGYKDPAEISKETGKSLAQQVADMTNAAGKPLHITEIMARFGYDPHDKAKKMNVLGSLNQAVGRYLSRPQPSTYESFSQTVVDAPEPVADEEDGLL